MKRWLLSPTLITAVAGTACGQQCLPVAADAGPLVCFSTHRREPHPETTLHVASCLGDTAAQPFWRGPGNVRVVCRLAADHLLLASFGEPYALVVVDLAAGSHRVLAEGSPHDFVAVHGDDVLFLGDDRWGKGDNYLYARPWATAGERRRLAAATFASVPLIVGNLAFGVTAGEREIWAISLTQGNGRRIHELPAGTVHVRLALSPGAQRLAVGCSGDWHGRLAVVDIATGKTLRSWPGLPIELSPDSSFLPTLEVGWADDDHVVCSETRGHFGADARFVYVRRELASGEVRDETTYARQALFHQPPPATPAPAQTAPAFTLRDRDDGGVDLVAAGNTTAIVSLPSRRDAQWRVQLSPGGQFAVVGTPAGGCELHRPERAALSLCEQTGFDLTWLAAVEPAGR